MARLTRTITNDCPSMEDGARGPKVEKIAPVALVVTFTVDLRLWTFSQPSKGLTEFEALHIRL
ncbi:hypothetical protein GCM10007874_45660 [Labrys miyagiensis]|uniref:Uncharacterized protein n=1 Tax=Labrys miyagiensis TaxID=346912 RepID=A0ABQ6CN38_9HYPH|nr:hypothetical protein GCM10007874_45660 [Labrys miyagiensis]